MKELAKKLARMVLGDYSAYYIYSRSAGDRSPSSLSAPAAYRVTTVDRGRIESSTDPLMRKQAWYAGPDSHAYACLIDERIVAVCFYWFGERYRQSAYWPLADGEAKLVQIISLPEVRARGVGAGLIAMSHKDMMKQGFSKTYARTWHSNIPAMHTFARAGWTRIAVVVEINPLRRIRPFRVRLHLHPRRERAS